MSEISARYNAWLLRATDDPELIPELESIRDNSDEIEDRFYRHLTFGTGGLRGVLGAGTNRMNIYTVYWASQGLSEYLLEHCAQPSVAIAYDSRIKSQYFAEAAADIFIKNGIQAYIFPKLMPTPALSFAVRSLGCSAGVVITASHNPANYNGYKVYDSEGCQIADATASEILGHMKCIDPLDAGYGKARSPLNKPELISPEAERDFYDAEAGQRLEKAPPAPLFVVYTPLNGTGGVPVPAVLKQAGYEDIYMVGEQGKPDGRFPTCPYPNPELAGTLSLGIRALQNKDADLLLATDPDCDRVGVAVKEGEGFRILSGNEIGVLLLDYICRERLNSRKMPARPVALKTIVTTEMARKVAANYGVELIDVLTGFKYIGEIIGRLEKAGEAGRYIFGFEESCGYLSGTHVRDKDAVNACLLICDMAARCKAEGLTLAGRMERLYREYGYYADGLASFDFYGEKGMQELGRFMADLRGTQLKTVEGQTICGKRDYLSPDSGSPDGFMLPPGDVLQYMLADGTLITLRPSGTEPKLKVYCQVIRENGERAKGALNRYMSRLKELVEAFK